MPSTTDTSLTSEQREQLLGNEQLIADLLAIRNPSAPPAAGASQFLKFLQSSAGTAFITVIFGGIMGSVVTAVFQMYSKQREMQLSAYQQKLTKRQETVSAAFELIGNSFAPADTLYRFHTELGNSPTGKNPGDQAAWQKQWDAVRQDLEGARRNWSSSEKRTFLSLSYYFNDDRDVKRSWGQVNTALTGWFDYVSDKCRDGSPELCKSGSDQAKTALNHAIDTLGCSLENAAREESEPRVKCEGTG